MGVELTKPVLTRSRIKTGTVLFYLCSPGSILKCIFSHYIGISGAECVLRHIKGLFISVWKTLEEAHLVRHEYVPTR